ncbi:MAG: trigger factor [Candidatus Omnitrophota bacterium]
MLIKKCDVKKLDACKRQINIEIAKETVDQKLDQVLSEINKNAKVDGFRPGKAPRYIIDEKHGNQARGEAIKRLISDSYDEAIAGEKLAPLDLPEIFDVEFKEGTLFYKAKLEVKPEVKIKDYRGIKITRKPVEVSSDEIQKAIEYLKGTQGLNKDTPADDAFARGLGYPSLKSLEDSIKKQLEVNKEQIARSQMEEELIEQLLANASFVLPEAAVKKQLERLWRDAQHRLMAQGVKKEDLTAKEEEYKKELKKAAERDIAVYFIFDKIAELENIKPEKPEGMFRKVLEFLMREAKWEGGETNGQ